jgi:SAM-dependent methyltransferase
MTTLNAFDESCMSGGEIDRRMAERDAADRAYNDALTRVDQALPRLSEPPPTIEPVRDHVVILPSVPPHLRGWRGRLARFVWRLVAPVFARQQEFNATTATHLEEMADSLRRIASVLPEAHIAHRDDFQAFASFNSILVQYLQQITPFIDTKVRAVDASLEEVRMAATTAHRAAIAARREVERLAEHPQDHTAAEGANDRGFTPTIPVSQGPSLGTGYVGFEDLFRGTSEEISARQSDYVDRFAGAVDVLDIGCGRGEFLQLLSDRGVRASGVDKNVEMVEVCVARGLRAQHADALDYLSNVPDESLGGLTALQVVEHLDPEYLVRLLQTAFVKLRPGATIVLETINAACWVAFFESYIRDITHVRPLHPDTLKFLVVATGFEQVDVHFRSPIPESGRLQHIGVEGLPVPLADIARTINANVDRLNERLFTCLDYAVIGIKGGG